MTWTALPKFSGGAGIEPLLRVARRSDGPGKRLIGNAMATRLLPARVTILIRGQAVALRAVRPEDAGNIIRKVSRQGPTCVIAATGLPTPIGACFKIVPGRGQFLLRRTK